jgi:hypothetical protein
MAEHSTSTHDLIARLLAYQEASNSYDIDAAVAMFAEDGYIELRGKRYGGEQALRAAHEYDMGSATRVSFDDFDVRGDFVTCTFVFADELDRIVGTGGTRCAAEFTFKDGLIASFSSLPPSDQEMQRHRQAKAPFFAWAREHFPEEVARPFAFDYETGASLRRVALAWRDSLRQDTEP